jgi:hypothetical protein
MMPVVVYLLCVVIHLAVYSTAYDVECGVCQCYSGDDINIAVCEGAGLTQLPVLPADFAIMVDTVHLTRNSITHLNITTLGSWRSLAYLDLRSNPLECDVFSGIDFKEAVVKSDCIKHTTQYPEASTSMTTLQSVITDLPVDTTLSAITDTTFGMDSASTHTLSHTLKTDMVTPDTNTVYTPGVNTVYGNADTSVAGGFDPKQTSHVTVDLEGNEFFLFVFCFCLYLRCESILFPNCMYTEG